MKLNFFNLMCVFVVSSTSFCAFAGGAPEGNSLKPSMIEALKERRALLRSWAPKCADGSLTMSDCPFYDSVEYSGMLCLSGETDYCDPVRRSQGSDGRFYRSPGYVGQPNLGEESFSNDMDRGVWAYIIATEDKVAAQKYMDYVKSNQYKLCPGKDPAKACATRGTYWPFAEQVFDWLGLPRDHHKMKGYKFLLDYLYSPWEARFQPVSFQMILTGEKVYTLRKLQEKGYPIKNRSMVDHIAKIIYRRDKGNPFSDFLANGSTDAVAQHILDACPSAKPVVPLTHSGNPMYTEPANGPWPQGSGHYCIFMINAVLGSAN